MIKLQNDFDLSTIIEKGADILGVGGWANILGGRCPGGGGHVTATHLYHYQLWYH